MNHSLETIAPAPEFAQQQAVENSLFERFAWLYVFFRERLFRDDTERIIEALWPEGGPAKGTRIMELGCGPAFYSCQLALRFPETSVHGVDRCARQLEWAQRKVRALKLRNCTFAPDNVLQLSNADNSVDALVAARLFTILPDAERALGEMHRILCPGGRCFIAEPRYAIWASLPLCAMWIMAALTGMNSSCPEPRKAVVMSGPDFKRLFTAQPWRRVQTWQDGRYQYALCEKD